MSAEKITVLNPVGFPPKVVAKPLAPRLSTLDGKTVYLVDCRFDDSDVFLKQMQAWFGEHMPGVRTVFKPISSVYLKDDPATVGTPYCASIVIACAATAGAQVLQWPTPTIAACPLALISSQVAGSSLR